MSILVQVSTDMKHSSPSVINSAHGYLENFLGGKSGKYIVVGALRAVSEKSFEIKRGVHQCACMQD